MTIVTAALVVFGFAMGYALRCAVTLPARGELPPATARQIKRARKAARTHLD